jgi:hypothetical protein
LACLVIPDLLGEGLAVYPRNTTGGLDIRRLTYKQAGYPAPCFPSGELAADMP